MFLSSKNFSWLNPAKGTEYHTRSSVGGVMALISVILELLIVAIGSFLCSDAAHWTLFGVCALFLFVIFAVTLSSNKQNVQELGDCDWYHELILIVAMLLSIQFGLCFGAIGVVRGYSKFLGLSQETTKLLIEIDWLPTTLSILMLVSPILAYALFTTRETKQPK